MSIFSRIKDAIFHRTPTAGAAPEKTAQSPAKQPSTAARNTPAAAPSSTTSAAPKPQPVDVEAVLEERAAKNSQKLNWRTSIVDLMKLLDLDPTLENRKELAKELGYTGDTADSAAMNIWLHKQVMLKLESSGGTVPDSLKQ